MNKNCDQHVRKIRKFYIGTKQRCVGAKKKKKKKRERAQVSMFSLVSQPPSSHGRSMGSMVNSCILQCGLAKIITKQLGIYSHHSLMVLLKGARPAVSQSDAWARSGQLYMFACGCKQCINTSHKTTRFWRGRDSSCTCRPNTVFRWVWTFRRGRLYLKPNTNSGKIPSLQLHGMTFTKFITVTFTKAREGIWCKSQSFTRKSLRVGVFQN